jgi:hypothetical protein
MRWTLATAAWLTGLAALLPASCARTPVPSTASAQAPTSAVLASQPIRLNVERLEADQLALWQATTARLDPMIERAKGDGTANVLTWEQLYAPLEPEQRAFVDAFRALRAESLGATSHRFDPIEDAQLVRVEPQQTVAAGVATPLPAQYLPRPVHDAYRAMMAAMELDLGRRLLVESGYRSPAYQLYLFMHYMANHDHSIRETNRHVALPGYSEHGAPQRQAIDFINAEGINGEERPEEFEALPEYAWLEANAGTFGFHLSYPRDNPHNTAFEPWHWHFEAP